MNWIEDSLQYEFDFTVYSIYNYKEWMRHRRGVRDFGYIVDKGTRELSADLNDLKFLGASLGTQAQQGQETIIAEIGRGNEISLSLREGLADLDNTVRQGLSELSDSVRKSADQVVSALHWGFSELAGRLDILNSSIRELIIIQKRPSKTWADEQYEFAQDDSRRGLYADALTNLDRAINGYGGNTGRATDFRFHMLKGLILLGDLNSASVEHIDLKAAESAFVRSAECANTDNPLSAGRTLVLAGRAAYLDNRLEAALSHTSEGLRILKSDATGLLLLARIYFALGRCSEGAPHLVEALMIDPVAAVEVAGIADFVGNSVAADYTREAIATATKQHSARLKLASDELLSSIKACSALSWAGIAGRDIVSEDLSRLERHRADCTRRAAGAPLITVARMRREIKKSTGKLPEIFEKYKDGVRARVSANLKRVGQSRDDIARRVKLLDDKIEHYYEREMMRGETIFWVFFGFIGLTGCFATSVHGDIGKGLIVLFAIPISCRIIWSLLGWADRSKLRGDLKLEQGTLRELDKQIEKLNGHLNGLATVKPPFLVTGNAARN